MMINGFQGSYNDANAALEDRGYWSDTMAEGWPTQRNCRVDCMAAMWRFVIHNWDRGSHWWLLDITSIIL